MKNFKVRILSILFIYILSLFYTSIAFADSVVTIWNNVQLDAIRHATISGPTIASRALAIVNTCMYDAWAAYDPHAVGTRPNGPTKQIGGTQADKEKAISFAAYQCLLDLYPEQKIRFDTAMATLNYDPNDRTIPASVGMTAAASVIAFRHHDGSNQLGDLHPGAYSDYTNYQPVNTPDQLNDPNRWQPLRFSNGTVPQFVTPHWGRVTPFALTAHDQYLPPAPYLFPHGIYTQQANDLITISANLTDHDKMVAEFWAEETPGKLSPPGHLNVFAQMISHRDRFGVDDDIKLFFILNNALFDAGISVWDTKRFYDYIRPISAIRFLKKDILISAWGGPCQGTKLINGKDWIPYTPEILLTPPFPEYVSGHATFGATAAEVFKRYTHSDKFNAMAFIPAGSSVIEGSAICPASPVPAKDIVLTWKTFSALAEEDELSRLFMGVHFKDAAKQGIKIGRKIASQALGKAETFFNGSAMP